MILVSAGAAGVAFWWMEKRRRVPAHFIRGPVARADDVRSGRSVRVRDANAGHVLGVHTRQATWLHGARLPLERRKSLFFPTGLPLGW
jgi:hypothetical protein